MCSQIDFSGTVSLLFLLRKEIAHQQQTHDIISMGKNPIYGQDTIYTRGTEDQYMGRDGVELSRNVTHGRDVSKGKDDIPKRYVWPWTRY